MSSVHVFDAMLQFGFMRRSFVACFALSLSLPPLGIFLLLRRMSLVGDALSHAVLPGVAIGYLLFGVSFLAMGLGGLIAGVSVAFCANWISQHAQLNEDASFAGLYLGSLDLGVTLISMRSSGVDLLHLLFGSILAVDNDSLIFIGVVASATLLVLTLFYRGFVYESFDRSFLKTQSPAYPARLQALFMTLLVINLVAGFQILGTLMTVGLMMLPAIAARCWSNRLPIMLLIGTLLGILSSAVGLSLSWYLSVPAGPAIVLCGTSLFLLSVLFGSEKGIFALQPNTSLS